MPCRFLATTALTDAPAAFKHACSTDWPAPAAKDCDQLDLERNCIYAVHGYAFKHKKYRDIFTATGWYKPRKSFKQSDLSAAATANVAALKTQAGECRRLGDPGELKDPRVDQWLGGLAKSKPEIPKIALDVSGSDAPVALTAKQMTKSLVLDKAFFKVGGCGVRKGTPSATAAKQLAGKQLETFTVIAGNCPDGGSECDDSTITLVFDGAQLVALETFAPKGDD